MKSEWLGTEAEKQIKKFLEKAGIPLQIRTGDLCNRFCQSHAKSGQTSITTERVVYAPSSSEEKQREIDQRVQIYEELKVDELTGIQLMVNLPIECKYRADMEAFGFATPSPFGNIHTKFPISGEFAGSIYFGLLRKSCSCLSELHPFDIALVKIEEGKTPKGIHKENLIYNTAGSLYDFIQFDLEEYKGDVRNGPIVEELFQNFQSYLLKHGYYWSQVLRDWIDKEVVLEECERYNKKRFSDSRIHHTVIAHLPIVCIDSPLYNVRLGPRMNIEGFEDVPFLTTSIRKQGWPGSVAIELLRRDPVVPVVVTNPSGLTSILEIGYEWYQDIKRILLGATRTAVRRAALESVFFQKVYHIYAETESIRYRSDLDDGTWP